MPYNYCQTTSKRMSDKPYKKQEFPNIAHASKSLIQHKEKPRHPEQSPINPSGPSERRMKTETEILIEEITSSKSIEENENEGLFINILIQYNQLEQQYGRDEQQESRLRQARILNLKRINQIDYTQIKRKEFHKAIPLLFTSLVHFFESQSKEKYNLKDEVSFLMRQNENLKIGIENLIKEILQFKQKNEKIIFQLEQLYKDTQLRRKQKDEILQKLIRENRTFMNLSTFSKMSSKNLSKHYWIILWITQQINDLY